MPTRPIGQGWHLDLPSTFHERQDDHQYTFWHEGHTVYAVVFPTTAADGESALAEFVRDRGDKPTERYHRQEDGLLGEGWLLPEQDGDYWGLNTWTAIAGSVACVTFYFPEKRDVTWALDAWQSVRPALVAGTVQ